MFDDNPDFEKFSLEYSNNPPRDYDVSKIRFTFDFIYLVFKRDANIDSAIRGVSNEYGLSESYLEEYLIENKYIINKTNMREFSKQLKMYNTKRLKKMLKSHGLKASGKRERIEKRIFENKLFTTNYYLSSKSKIFYKNKKRRIKIFDEYLSDYYYFDEFNDFYMDNYRKKEANIPIEFMNLHINKAVEDKNHERFIVNNRIMASHFFNKKQYRKTLECILKIFCMDLNPVWKADELKSHVGLNFETYDEIKILSDELSKNTIINTYYWIWDSFEFDMIIVSKYDGYRCLKDILNNKDLDKINKDLNNRFYQNDDLKIKKITQKTLFDF